VLAGCSFSFHFQQLAQIAATYENMVVQNPGTDDRSGDHWWATSGWRWL